MKRERSFPILTKFRFPLYLVLFQLIIISLWSCSSEDDGPDCSLEGTNFSISDISGNWTATSAIFFNNATEPVQTVDVVAEGGTVTLSIQSNGRFTLNVAESGASNTVSSGDLCFDEDLLVVRFDGDAADDWEYFSTQYNPGANSLSISGPTEFDFDGDGTLEPADVGLDLTRS